MTAGIADRPSPAAPVDPPASDTVAWWRDRLLWLVTAVVTVPLLAVAAVVATRDWFPASDWALIEIRTRDVGTSSTPLLGPFSRYGWNHPGPLMFWLLAPAYRLGGQSASALMAGAAVLNAIGLAAGTAVVRRVGGTAAVLVWGVAAAVFVHAAADVLIDPWNPYIAVVPFAVFVVSCWGLATGVWPLAALVAATGSLLVQSHVGYAALVPPLVVWAVVWAIVATRRRWSADRMRVAGSLAAAVAISLVLWAAPVGEQVSADPGNMTQIVEYFTDSGDEPVAGWSAAATVVGRSLAPFGPWLGFDEPIDPSTLAVADTAVWWALPALGALAVVTALAARRRDRTALLASGTVAVALLAGAWAVSRINGIAYFYIVRWWWAMGLLTWFTVAWLAVRAVARRRRGVPARLVTAATVAAVVVMAAAGSVTVATATSLPDPGPGTDSLAVGALRPQLLGALPPLPDGEAYLVRPLGFSLFETYFGVVNELDAAGVAVVGDPWLEPHFGSARTVGGDGAPDTLVATVVVASGEDFGDLADNAEWELVATYDPLTPAQRAELEGLQDRVRQALVAAGRADETEAVVDRRVLDVLRDDNPGVDAATAARIGELMFGGTRVRVFVRATPVS